MLIDILRSARPKQWAKNIFFFAALVFDAKLLKPDYILPSLAGFVLLCCISGAVYIINDLADQEKDQQHPTKRNRPIASGRLPRNVATITAIILVTISLVFGTMIEPYFGLVLLGYFILNLAYTFYLKRLVIVDVISIATGFMLRVIAGVVIVNVERFSPWLYVCMIFLALFLALGKRRHEMTLLQQNARAHRAILNEYSMPLLDQLITIVVAGTLISYALYTFSAEALPGNHLMMLTIGNVLYGLFRYLYLIHVRGRGGAPEEVLLEDKPFILNAIAWAVIVLISYYFL
ncbi:MAG: decaprenyl-phosphate phosphoribosyltransferase [Chloroflexota bacterium]